MLLIIIIIIDINNQYSKFNVNLMYYSIRRDSYKVLELMIEYANKNNYVLDLNNKYNPEDSLACKKLLDHLQVIKNFLLNYIIKYAEVNNIIIDFNIISSYNKILHKIFIFIELDVLEIIINYSKRRNLTI